jgi:hypothetical protein
MVSAASWLLVLVCIGGATAGGCPPVLSPVDCKEWLKERPASPTAAPTAKPRAPALRTRVPPAAPKEVDVVQAGVEDESDKEVLEALKGSAPPTPATVVLPFHGVCPTGLVNHCSDGNCECLSPVPTAPPLYVPPTPDPTKTDPVRLRVKSSGFKEISDMACHAGFQHVQQANGVRCVLCKTREPCYVPLSERKDAEQAAKKKAQHCPLGQKLETWEDGSFACVICLPEEPCAPKPATQSPTSAPTEGCPEELAGTPECADWLEEQQQDATAPTEISSAAADNLVPPLHNLAPPSHGPVPASHNLAPAHKLAPAATRTTRHVSSFAKKLAFKQTLEHTLQVELCPKDLVGTMECDVLIEEVKAGCNGTIRLAGQQYGDPGHRLMGGYRALPHKILSGRAVYQLMYPIFVREGNTSDFVHHAYFLFYSEPASGSRSASTQGQWAVGQHIGKPPYALACQSRALHPLEACRDTGWVAEVAEVTDSEEQGYSHARMGVARIAAPQLYVECWNKPGSKPKVLMPKSTYGTPKYKPVEHETMAPHFVDYKPPPTHQSPTLEPTPAPTHGAPTPAVVTMPFDGMCPEGAFLDSDVKFGQHICSSCQPGFFCALSKKYPCPANKYSAKPGASFCETCLEGQKRNIRRTRCKGMPKGSCPKGKHVSKKDVVLAGVVFHKRSCLVCTAGRYNADIVAEQCALCPLGKYSFKAAVSCISACQEHGKGTVGSSVECLPGFYYAGGTKSCEPCPVGKYQENEVCCATAPDPTALSHTCVLQGSRHCKTCVIGVSYTDNCGQISCTRCPTITTPILRHVCPSVHTPAPAVPAVLPASKRYNPDVAGALQKCKTSPCTMDSTPSVHFKCRIGAGGRVHEEVVAARESMYNGEATGNSSHVCRKQKLLVPSLHAMVPCQCCDCMS